MPPRHALDVLIAFRMDVTKLRYENWDEVIHYCRYSAMPVGRFMLDVHGESTSTWAASDALCAGLQINNHLQDCGKDFRDLNRVYLPRDALAAAGASRRAARRGDVRRRRCCNACSRSRCVPRALLDESKSLGAEVRDLRLGLEISVIQTFADRIVGMLKVRDPLSETVHLGPVQLLGHSFSGMASELIAARRSGRRPVVQTGGRRMTLDDHGGQRRVTAAAASGSSFYAAMRILPREQREAMFQIYSFCRQVDDIADSDGPRARAAGGDRSNGATISTRSIRAIRRRGCRTMSARFAASGCKREDFLAIIDGMEMDIPQDIRAPDLATLDLYCDRVASAVGRLSVRVFGAGRRRRRRCWRIISAARCS